MIRVTVEDVPVVCPSGNRDNPLHWASLLNELIPGHISVRIIHAHNCSHTGERPMDGCTCETVNMVIDEMAHSPQDVALTN